MTEWSSEKCYITKGHGNKNSSLLPVLIAPGFPCHHRHTTLSLGLIGRQRFGMSGFSAGARVLSDNHRFFFSVVLALYFSCRRRGVIPHHRICFVDPNSYCTRFFYRIISLELSFSHTHTMSCQMTNGVTSLPLPFLSHSIESFSLRNV